ncbi:GNAT family N-acetyltransferase [Bifidobacterium subtile]|uniref:GNAT family N-acetyltransferase n=1 Tax=Bifidobacterium subtile TaxID=77635 RepID=UPI0039C866EF
MSLLRSLREAFAPETDGVHVGVHMPDSLAAPAGAVPITLRAMDAQDYDEWNDLRWRNREWLRPWESGDPQHGPGISFNAWLQRQHRDESNGTGALSVIEYQMRIVGQVSLGAISYGSMRTGVVGYWVDHRHAGLNIAPTAVALLADWALHDPDGPGLHRLEIAMLPHNARSRRVAEKLHAHHEGIRPRYMYVDGAWRDHDTFSLLAEDAPEGFAKRLIGRHARE